MTLRAITIDQPYPTLIAENVKTIETRGRSYPWTSAIGETIAVHASVRIPADPLVLGDYRVRGYGRNGRALVGPGLPEFRSTPRLEGYILPLGAIVATALLADVIPIDERWGAAHFRAKPGVRGRALMLRRHQTYGGDTDGLWLISSDGGRGDVDRYVEDQIPFGNFKPGNWALLLEDVTKLSDPVRKVGGHHQGLWTVPDESAAEVYRQTAQATA